MSLVSVKVYFVAVMAVSLGREESDLTVPMRRNTLCSGIVRPKHCLISNLF